MCLQRREAAAGAEGSAIAGILKDQLPTPKLFCCLCYLLAYYTQSELKRAGFCVQYPLQVSNLTLKSRHP